jgi:hypothetical protein
MGSRALVARWVSAASLLVACGGSSHESGFGTGQDGGLAADGAPLFADGGVPTFGDGAPTGEAGSHCPLSTQYVYTVAIDNTLYRFDPPSLTFTTIGVMNCQAAFGTTPYSMSVDRNGTAWVVFSDGHLFRVSTANAACQSTSYAPGQNGFITFGMGFSTDSPGGDAETLFVSDSGQHADGTYGPTKGLARLDTRALTLTPIGAYDLITARAEMTGTGDARLFGAFEGSPYVVAGIDKTNAKILSQAPQNSINYAPTTSNFAFAFWGGDFWLFVGPGTSTDVFQYRPSTGATNKVSSVTFEIVGAGVSTCAPTTPPK